MPNRIIQSVLSLSVLSLMMGSAYAKDSQENSREVQAKNSEPVQLETVVLTASGYKQDKTKAPASMTVITRKELENRQYSDITDVLRNTPGVVISGAGSAQTVSIRGMGSSYTLFLVNGKRQFSKDVNPNGDDNGFEKNILPPVAEIERIEVIRGPASTLYGTDAMGGVVNIITKKVSTDWSGTAELGAVLQDHHQSGDIKNGSAYLSGPLIANKLGMQLGVSKSKRDEDRYVGGFRSTDVESLNSRFTYLLNDNHDLEFEANFMKQESESTAGKTIVSTGADSYGRNYRQVYGLTHNGHYGDNLSSNSYIQYENSKNPDRSNSSTGLSGIELETWLANSQWHWKLSDHNLIGGLYFKNESLVDKATNQNADMPVTELERWAFAVFAEDTWAITDTFNLTTGLRYDHDENYDGNFSPRLYGVYTPTDAWTFKGGVSTGYKQPDLKQSSSDVHSVTGKGSAFIMGNDNLKPEKSVSYEFGTAWQGDQSKASVTAFYTEFKDKITEIRECSSPNGSNTNAATWACKDPFGRLDAVTGDVRLWNFISSRINVDEATMQGVEATFDTELADGVNLSTNYTYTETEQKSGDLKGQPLNQVPKHMFNATVDYTINDALDIWTRLHHRSETSSYLGRASMSAPTPAYQFLDVGFNYQFTANLKGKFGVYNILDEKAEDADGDQVLDGRRYGISFLAKF
ncbi:TonB-dependent receptor [Acinetobacter sichuanensis]|uniref:TonB-dependent receptor domain-containing protein n=1 Tax=Acinetobacter sichuanensis TaxID=2136183 RepID=UPI00280C4422|nr:TonB-dependent receptor [Acinetobacter sichuanensis]MDQ9020700.1 TonB-dependent receptor [Acinetobacter sichuanensis]